MKKILSFILLISLILSLTSCGKKEEVSITPDEQEIIDATVTEPAQDTEKEDADAPAQDAEPAPQKPSQSANQTSPTPPAQSSTPSKPETNTQNKPQEDAASSSTLGGILLNDFKTKASSHNDALSLAQALVENSAIQFSGMATPVEPGYLTGFNDKEITGFSQGAMFAPMIGTIPFVGYVFVLDSEASAGTFTETLRANANLRWNLCTEAEEMLTATSGNKVFFVMCPKAME